MPINLTLDGPVSLNLDDIKEVVEEGWHLVEIESAEARESSNGNPQIGVRARIVDENDADYDRQFFWNLTFISGFSMQLVKRCLSALGFPQQLEYSSLQELASDMEGRQVEAQVTHRTYEGNKQENVTKWRAPQYDLSL